MKLTIIIFGLEVYQLGLLSLELAFLCHKFIQFISVLMRFGFFVRELVSLNLSWLGLFWFHLNLPWLGLLWCKLV